MAVKAKTICPVYTRHAKNYFKGDEISSFLKMAQNNTLTPLLACYK
jgi:hypothetical protein